MFNVCNPLISAAIHKSKKADEIRRMENNILSSSDISNDELLLKFRNS